ncbi:MAG: hypothetical protein JXA30_08160 [Deltaproteobacteria bacterium]|nr:hypothetical protein [Deltaproteobacteria bacterium]
MTGSAIETRRSFFERLNLYKSALPFLLAFALHHCAALDYEEPTTPEAAARAFAIALDSRDYERAYSLMSNDYRERVGFESFQSQISENPQEIARLSYDLAHLSGAREEAVVIYGKAEQLRLVRASGRWKITTDLVGFYDQSSPRAALESLVRALENGRFDVVMRLIPLGEKQGITQERLEKTWSGKGRDELERILNNLRDHVDNPIEIVGRIATMPYAEYLSVEFIREGANWKIEKLE